MLGDVLIKNKTYRGGYATKCGGRGPWERWEEVPVPRKRGDRRKGTYAVWGGHFGGEKGDFMPGWGLDTDKGIRWTEVFFFFLAIESHTSTAVAPSANRMGC